MSDFINLGAGIFASEDKKTISWDGKHYVQTCSKFVHEDRDGTRSHCMKRVGHPNECEDFDGRRHNATPTQDYCELCGRPMGNHLVMMQKVKVNGREGMTPIGWGCRPTSYRDHAPRD